MCKERRQAEARDHMVVEVLKLGEPPNNADLFFMHTDRLHCFSAT